jgi:hypothetical protein
VTIGRLRPPADPLIDDAVDKALHDAEWPGLELEVPEWDQATGDAGLLLVVEAWESNRALVARDPEGIGAGAGAPAMGATFDAATVATAWAGQRAWQRARGALRPGRLPGHADPLHLPAPAQ